MAVPSPVGDVKNSVRADREYRKLQKSSNLPLRAAFCHLNEVEHELHFQYSIVILTIVFDLTFTETLVTHTPFLIILTTMKKPSSYLTMSIPISTDLLLLTYIHVWNIDKNMKNLFVINFSLYFDLRFIT